MIAFLESFQTMWSSGRQSRFLADISPKFVAAALMKSKNPVFLEAVDLGSDGQIAIKKLHSVVSDYEKYIVEHVFAVQQAVFDKTNEMVTMKEGFGFMEDWVKKYYQV